MKKPPPKNLIACKAEDPLVYQEKGSPQDPKTSHLKPLRTGSLPLGVIHTLGIFLDPELPGRGWAEAEATSVGSDPADPWPPIPFLLLCLPSVCIPCPAAETLVLPCTVSPGSPTYIGDTRVLPVPKLWVLNQDDHR